MKTKGKRMRRGVGGEPWDDEDDVVVVVVVLVRHRSGQRGLLQ
jgi:hypothetical protein